MNLRIGARERVTKLGGRCVIGTLNHLLRLDLTADWANSDLGVTFS